MKSFDQTDDGLYMESWEDWEDWEEDQDNFGQQRFQPRVLNTLVRLIGGKIPHNRLQSF